MHYTKNPFLPPKMTFIRIISLLSRKTDKIGLRQGKNHEKRPPISFKAQIFKLDYQILISTPTQLFHFFSFTA